MYALIFRKSWRAIWSLSRAKRRAFWCRSEVTWNLNPKTFNLLGQCSCLRNRGSNSVLQCIYYPDQCTWLLFLRLYILCFMRYAYRLLYHAMISVSHIYANRDGFCNDEFSAIRDIFRDAHTQHYKPPYTTVHTHKVPYTDILTTIKSIWSLSAPWEYLFPTSLDFRIYQPISHQTYLYSALNSTSWHQTNWHLSVYKLSGLVYNRYARNWHSSSGLSLQLFTFLHGTRYRILQNNSRCQRYAEKWAAGRTLHDGKMKRKIPYERYQQSQLKSPQLAVESKSWRFCGVQYCKPPSLTNKPR